jgi:hypothetical protein
MGIGNKIELRLELSRVDFLLSIGFCANGSGNDSGDGKTFEFHGV